MSAGTAGTPSERKSFRSRGGLRSALIAFGFVVFATGATAADSAQSLFAAAGNTDDETVRLTHLRALAATDIALLDAPTRAELTTLLPVVEAWAEGRARAMQDVARGEGEVHRYLHHFFEKATLAYSPTFPTPPRATSALYPLWAFYRARFLTWVMIEDSSVLNVPERKTAFVGEAERCFDLAHRAFPENELLRIYTGKNLPSSDLTASDDRAPAWANHQRRALTQLHRIIRWWIAERQLTNGEFGGKWGDDVEMWRWWAPILIGFDDPVINASQARLARGNLSRPALAGGYTSQLTDVEHTAEETADTLTPMQHVAGDNPEWATRTRRLLALADTVWWGDNAQGKLQFKHIDFNHERLGPDAARAYDTGYHVRVMQPALLLWQRTRDPALGHPLTRWLRTWAEAALSTDNGKPAGIVPAALQWPSGRVGSSERGWIGPAMAGDAMESLYSWPAYPARAMTVALLQAHALTGHPSFVEPLLRMAELRRAHLAAGDPDGPAGRATWAAHRLPRVMNEPLAKWRQLTGDNRFDDLLLADAGSYVRLMIGRDKSALTRDLAATARSLSVNWPMFTTEVRFTDRVLSFPRFWPRTLATGLPRVDDVLLYTTVTGDPGAVEDFPLNGARWHTLPLDLAVLVTENRRDRFAAELFHFGDQERRMDVSLLTLEPGDYTWRVETATGRPLSNGKRTGTVENRRLSFAVPSRIECRVIVERAP
ncbi:MAG: hypothetical protein EXS32_14330 [Opitutus sp.]|nr:hypothetical protein [Opitutus sp.]